MLARGSSMSDARRGPVAVLGIGFFYTRIPKQFASVSLFLPPRTVPATNRAKRHRRLRQSPAPRKLRSFQKGGRSEGKGAAKRRASRAAPLDFLDQKGAKTTQRNDLR